MATPFRIACSIGDAMDDVDPDVEPEEEEEGNMSMAEFVAIMRQQGRGRG
jgi:hypothetical protein